MNKEKDVSGAGMIKIIDRLFETGSAGNEELKALIDGRNEETAAYLFEKARIRQQEHFGRRIYLRGLIEFTNYCKNDCYYCGIRRSNRAAQRYRLLGEEILSCCQVGYELGFRTFVLQGGEDPYFTQERLCRIVSSIKERWPDCAVTLSVGERPYEEYLALRQAGADRYLLRHETADREHYGKLHPPQMSWEHRMRCLRDLKQIGFQVGAGMMLQSPYQTTDHIIEDLVFLKDLQPDMIGIGPFIPHKDTPFRDQEAGTADLTLLLIGILRLMLPQALIPATTALGTIDLRGREKGILAGANVIMPNLSPSGVREKYLLYDGKICTGDEAAECHACLERRMKTIGYEIVVSRGDSPRLQAKRAPQTES